jgi:phosphohistidine phosphatase
MNAGEPGREGKVRMHLLHLLRHAKSSWKDDVEDHERPLSNRGRKEARLMGRHLSAAIEKLDLVLCSSAVRTGETLKFALEGFQTRPLCLIEDALYLADCDKLIDRLRRLEENLVCVLLIGHNPGLRDLAVALADPGAPHARILASGKFPTAACASFKIGTRWSGLGDARHHVIDYVTPTSLFGRKK